MITENVDQDHSNTFVRQVSKGSIFEDSIPYHETCLSIEYNSDEENIEENEQFKTNDDKRNDFCRQDSLLKSEEESEILYREESEIQDDRKDSVGSIDYPSYNPIHHWRRKSQNSQNYNSFSSDEEDDGVQHIVTADVHINATSIGN
ncbi:uncharacterized protein LOC111625512 [Centruroides sculpturatus]|uniref:uncharacterized protein LOC111625512 n=1 Tax=Centruroides sculpturatus TaxID=218467 RepID=UPI000C6E38E4|nr:uncharacterized protein LOC111625512 [Centruroides sculpturatus]